ncbi:hypothetical protein RUM43_004887 [Polyplax serrata]|uniref:Uncharacterized protein n=1 Tax=Polyplax serrata TaxID=468196 RepID=A0AAN8SBF8_POLSC
MLIGLVMYISIFKAEVGGKLRPTSQIQPAVFTYKYGYSFILYVSGFVSTEISGTCAVFLYIYWHQKDWRKKGYDLRSKFSSPAMVFDIDPINRLYPFCKKHSPYVSSSTGNVFSHSDEIIAKDFSPPLQRRLYLDHRHHSHGMEHFNGYYSPVCLKHSLSCSVVNELYSDATPQNRPVRIANPNGGFPTEPCHRHHLLSAYSYEFLSKKMSHGKFQTNWKNEESDDLDECSSMTTHEHDFVPFDLDEAAPVPIDSSKSLEDVLRDNEFFYRALSKTTPV